MLIHAIDCSNLLKYTTTGACRLPFCLHFWFRGSINCSLVASDQHHSFYICASTYHNIYRKRVGNLGVC
ncbi:hypothetical protein RvY_09139, partial [Ramazzottius varieornatus]